MQGSQRHNSGEVELLQDLVSRKGFGELVTCCLCLYLREWGLCIGGEQSMAIVRDSSIWTEAILDESEQKGVLSVYMSDPSQAVEEVAFSQRFTQCTFLWSCLCPKTFLSSVFIFTAFFLHFFSALYCDLSLNNFFVRSTKKKRKKKKLESSFKTFIWANSCPNEFYLEAWQNVNWNWY